MFTVVRKKSEISECVREFENVPGFQKKCSQL